MINPRELRIGNYIYNLSSGSTEFAQVIEIDVEGYLMLQNKEDSYNSFLDEDVKPIPLTEDILLKCGFEKNNIPRNCGVHNIFYNEYMTIHHEENFYWSVYDEYTDNYIKKQLVSLHELQNIFYDLTKTELNIHL